MSTYLNTSGYFLRAFSSLDSANSTILLVIFMYSSGLDSLYNARHTSRIAPLRAMVLNVMISADCMESRFILSLRMNSLTLSLSTPP